ncbi:serine/threonine protein phosphatase [Actinosynnema sp.]|uniref:serine/threonine protein phosphatase n=1 Tax=Actinosynnema sp. TaxID=1872144 RepID=UPI003F87ECC0
MPTRTARHHALAAALAALPDEELAARLAAAGRIGVGVGGEALVLDVAGAPVFAKRVPLTTRELAHPRSTANLFDLPLHHQYGLGGPSFSAWRELDAAERVTGAVLAGEATAFPLLHHWRVLPGGPPLTADRAPADDPATRARLEALAAAPSSLVLVTEHLPLSLEDWLRDDPLAKAEALARQLADITTSLRRLGLLHMDAHFGNLRVAEGRVHLTDFGLALSPRHDLSPAERDFARHHAGYDADHTAARLVNWLVTTIHAPEDPATRNAHVRRYAQGATPHGVPPPVAKLITGHAPAAAAMNDLWWRLFDGELTARHSAP